MDKDGEFSIKAIRDKSKFSWLKMFVSFDCNTSDDLKKCMTVEKDADQLKYAKQYTYKGHPIIKIWCNPKKT